MGSLVNVTALELEPEPRSVRTARVWICAQLNRIGREDLCDAAELCVSELVTNALLHSVPPIMVRLTGTDDHPRVEVHDASADAPALRDMTRVGRQTATVGRGLGIVATYSHIWGADVSETGKFVWFEPVGESEAGDDESDPGMDGDLFGIAELLAEAEAAVEEPGRRTVRLRNLPVPVLVRYQIWFEDLSRELRLLGLGQGAAHPLAVRLSEAHADWLAERRHVTGFEQIEAVMQAQRESVDIDLEVRASAGRTMARLLDLLVQADDLCREEQTLTLPPDAEVVQLRTWYHGEFVRQVRGEPPRPWAS